MWGKTGQGERKKAGGCAKEATAEKRARGREGSAMDTRREEERAGRGGKRENAVADREVQAGVCGKGTNRRDDLGQRARAIYM